MADEAIIRSSFRILKGTYDFQTHPQVFRTDITNARGPSPGVVLATTEGVNVDLSALTTPALCQLINLDSTNFVEYGIWDTVEFYPLGELLAGEHTVLRLSRNLGKSFGTGTGTVNTTTYSLRVKADTASCYVQVNAFDA